MLNGVLASIVEDGATVLVGDMEKRKAGMLFSLAGILGLLGFYGHFQKWELNPVILGVSLAFAVAASARLCIIKYFRYLLRY